MNDGNDRSYCIINIENVDEGQNVRDSENIELGLKKETKQDFIQEIPIDKNRNLYATEKLLILPSNDQLISTFKESSNSNFTWLILALLRLIKHFISATKLLWIVAIYTVVGANLFMWLEVPYDEEIRTEAREYHLMARASLLFKIQQIHQTRRILEKNQHWKQAVIEFEQAIDCGLPIETSQWTFWMSILYCATIYTTVGYGNIACITIAGRIATIIYAICGIPMMIVVLDQLSTFLLKRMKQTSNFFDDVIYYLGVRFRFIRLDTQESFLRYIAICRILSRLRLIPNTITLTVSEQPEENHPSSSSSTSSFLSTQSNVSMNKIKTVKSQSSKIQTTKFSSQKHSLKCAFGKGSLLDNLEPFQIESIVDPSYGLLAKKIFLSLPSREKSSSSKTPTDLTTEKTKTTVQLRLNEFQGFPLRESSTSPLQSRNSLNVSLEDAEQQQGHLTASKETLVEKTPPSSSGKSQHNTPILIALVLTTGWIFLAAAIFCLWEEWSYFTSIYFFFISMSTIGFGDITPQHPQYMIMSFFVVVVGLSLVNVCISVVQEKVAQLYMEILNKMLQQYMKACASGDLEAMKGAMTGFNARCKYLMPFISKNQGIRLMNKFKEDARSMGVDLPEVLTELNEENGRPTFCKIFDEKSDERVNQFLEKAHQQGKMRRSAHTQTKQIPLQKAHKFFISRADELTDKEDNREFNAQSLEVAVQTNSLTSILSNKTIQVNDLANKCSPSLHDKETEWEFQTEILSQIFVDRCTNTFTVPLRNQGIQPEVSCIIRILEDDEGSSDDIFDYPIEEESAEFSSSGLSALNQHYLMTSGSSRDDDLPERRLSVSSKRSQQMQRMEEIELEDYGLEKVARKSEPPPRVTIHMASTVFGTSDNEEAENKSKIDVDLNKRLKQRERRKKTREGLRFMRNVAIQTVYSKSDQLASQIGCPLCGLVERCVSTQNEFVVLENESQTDNEYKRSSLCSRGKRIQTDFQILINRPSQTQLSSTFQKNAAFAHVNGEESIAVLEAATHGRSSPFANIQKDMLDLKKAFGLDDQEVDVLREKLGEVKERRQKAKIKLHKVEQNKLKDVGATFSSSSSDADGGRLTKEDKLVLLSEIKVLRAAKMRKEDKDKISCEEEEEKDQRIVQEEMLLLDKFEQLDTLLSIMKSDETASFGCRKDGLRASTFTSDFIDEPVQFMDNSEVQTDAMLELVEVVKLNKVGSETNKWTQTDYLKQNSQDVEDKRKSLMEKVITLWRGKEGHSAKVNEKLTQKTIKQTIRPSSKKLLTRNTLEKKQLEKKEKNTNSEEEKVTKMEKEDLLTTSQTLVKNFEKTNYEEKDVNKRRLNISSKKMMLEGIMGTTKTTASSEPSGPSALPFDLSEVVLLTDRQTGIIEAMRRNPLYKDYKSLHSQPTEQQLIPLSSIEWAQLIRLFPELLDEKRRGQMVLRQSKSSTFDFQKNLIERKGNEGINDEGGKKSIKMIPLSKFIVLNQNEMTSSKKSSKDTSYVDLEYIRSWLSSNVGPSTSDNLRGVRFELEYYSRWLENWLSAGGDLATLTGLYDVPLRDISEFLNVRREAISQLERQKHQMDRMANLACRKDKTARMVDLSIQTGVLSRVVQTLGEELTEVSVIESTSSLDTMEVDYLTNPAFSIVRVPLIPTDGEKDN